MKIGFFSPLPPARTGVADYSAALLRAMRRSGSVGVNALGDVALYHSGNNALHRAIYQRALEQPGVTVLHDAVLQHFLLGVLGREEYIAEFVHNYGEWMRDFAADLWNNRARSAADSRYFEYPMLRRIAETSRAVIVHNPAAAAMVRRHAGQARIHEIPHLFDPPAEVSKIDTVRFRDALGLKPRTLLVGVFGYLRESKRLNVIARAMHRAWSSGAGAALLIAGDFVSSDLARSAGPWLTDRRILRVEHMSETDFWRFASATDVCVNLRYPAAGESSGIAVRMMGIGKAVVCTAGEETLRFPENAVLRVDPGPAEEEMLTRIFGWLARDREAAEEIGKRAARHIAAEHAVDKVAAKYWEVCQSLTI